MRMSIITGDCLGVMKEMEDNSISAIVTDPPYGLKFMGKEWDHGVPGVPFWKEAIRVSKPGSFLLAFGGTRTYHRLACAIEDAGWQIRDCIQWIYGSGFPKSHNHFGIEGYGTALKPAYEPIIMAMKPCEGTFKQNAEKWYQAGINIYASRIGKEIRVNPPTTKGKTAALGSFENCNGKESTVTGRWPANVILDEEAGKVLDEQSSASRFFYCPKASPSERGKENTHPTVKPIKLMEYLIKLVMPPKDGVLLDPFAGSGSTLVAAQEIGVKSIGIEKSAEYVEIARSRINNVEEDLYVSCV